MTQYPDLRSARKAKGLTLEAVASGLMRTDTLRQIEVGMRLPQKRTRHLIECLVGRVSWKKTLIRDRQNVARAVEEFCQIDQPGAKSRIYFLRQYLQLLTESTND